MAVNAVMQMLDNGLRHIVVVRNPNDKALEHVLLNHFGMNGPVTMVDDDHAGVLGAIRIGCDKIKEDFYAVFCCDNIYPEERYPSNRVAWIRRVGIERVKDLDAWDSYAKKYVSRRDLKSKQKPLEVSFLALTTPWIIDSADAENTKFYANVLDWLNGVNLPAGYAEMHSWNDLGTPQAYEDYWNQP